MQKLFKTAIGMLAMCVAFLSGLVCWIDTTAEYYAYSGADLWLVRMTGPFETPNREHVVYYSLKPDSILVDSLQYGIMIGLDRIYCNDCSPYAANAAREPGRAGTKQKIDSLHLWLIDPLTLSQKEISSQLTSTELINRCQFNSGDFMTSRGGWSGSCGDNDCITYEVYPLKTLADLKDSVNLGKTPSGFSGSKTDIVFQMDSSFLKTLPGSFKLKLEIFFEGGYRIEAERKVRKQ